MSDEPKPDDNAAPITPTPTPTPANDNADALKADLAAATDALRASVPDHLKAIVPPSLSGRELADWIAQCRATAIWERPAVPTTDTGKPTIAPVTPDPTTLPVFARMAAGYRK
ncbi:hypothetical protein [Sphingosinicella sp.]|uniref:hypothetical protein n=1 Tax=Sphingosinicella sp. TaxID=1917971 RepID=UPI0017C97F21|nr:hypothetical protein [Sphingosinicella sp.]MBA4757409.1 hypothetical protein [Sphingosinicella sp.]